MSTQYWSSWTLTKSAWSVKAMAGSPSSIARSQLRSIDPRRPSYDHSVWTWRSGGNATRQGYNPARGVRGGSRGLPFGRLLDRGRPVPADTRHVSRLVARATPLALGARDPVRRPPAGADRDRAGRVDPGHRVHLDRAPGHGRPPRPGRAGGLRGGAPALPLQRLA